MSNGENGTGTPPEAQVPKYRLDEVLEEKRQLQAQLAATTQILQQVGPRNAQTPAPRQEESAEMKKLKEEQPGLYAQFKAQEHRIRQANAMAFMGVDATQRLTFLQQFGERGQAKLEQVETVLTNLRNQGITHYTREDIFKNIIADEALRGGAPRATQAAPQANAAQAAPNDSAPSTDPSAAPKLPTTPSAAGTKESLEEMEARLANLEF